MPRRVVASRDLRARRQNPVALCKGQVVGGARPRQRAGRIQFGGESQSLPRQGLTHRRYLVPASLGTLVTAQSRPALGETPVYLGKSPVLALGDFAVGESGGPE